MSFLQWLKVEHGLTWDELMWKSDFLTIVRLSFEYEFFCYEKGIEPRWE